MVNSHAISTELAPILDVVQINGRKVLQRRDGHTTLPGQPRKALQGDALLPYLRQAHLTAELDKMAPKLYYLATPTHTHIAPLHHQRAMGRQIVVTEHPGLHLIWYHDRIFVKPIPVYMLSGAFWNYIAEADQNILRASLGFMRTYCYLIRYGVDFSTAIALELIPKVEAASFDFEDFIKFIFQFEDVSDGAVSPRYAYGSIRLTRLNYLALIFLGRPAYFALRPQYGEYIGHAFVPIITLFAILSTILSSMQVALAVQDPHAEASWQTFAKVAKWFSIAVIILVASLVVLLVIFIPLAIGTAQNAARRSELNSKKKQDENLAGEMTTTFI
ncbi:hypothetical protein K432DRAFT_430872 [Lepidopterella palustris CBS 459.81]|uniref:Uncharacterized protein n=1 Tax=Lepidopterella palustris CBS 459.81 TaxID=1314670 RepID=A0A8E2DWG6_9PEZI|nr:hypothetical protein K432DRAFT_430872 [Lepidopterella palustris CBS 459.81]